MRVQREVQKIKSKQRREDQYQEKREKDLKKKKEKSVQMTKRTSAKHRMPRSQGTKQRRR